MLLPLYKTVLPVFKVYTAKFTGKLVAPARYKPVLFESDKIPPTEDLFAVKVERSKVPDTSDTSPLMITLPVSIAEPDDLLTVKLLNVVAEIVCVPAPLKLTVPVPALNVPLFVQFPSAFMFTPFPPIIAPELIDEFPVMVKAAITLNSPDDTRRFPAMVEVE